ncbi:homeobox protein knotted-1-like 1 [Nicotiana tabacum]|uniref:Homeobox protein knotted-1-like 1 n=1 Tax=Nicotiana tabacum TaxID=4097 RepID=A0AC58SSI6_TOBAC
MLLEDIITRHEQDGPGPLYDNNSNSINIVVHELEEAEKAMGNMSDLIKAQIANHTLYQYLVSAYIDCRKVGAPPEMTSILSMENCIITSCPTEIGTDPELDEFMEPYCGILHKYKEELSKPFDEATAFLNNIKSQLNNLCNENLTPQTTAAKTGNYHSGRAFLILLYSFFS